jgi:hypothetical protein
VRPVIRTVAKFLSQSASYRCVRLDGLYCRVFYKYFVLIFSTEIQESTSHSMFTNPWACYIPKMTFLAFPQKKPYIKTSKKHTFSAHSTRLVTHEAKIEKKQLPFTNIQTIFRILTKSQNFSIKAIGSLFLWKKLTASCLTAVNQMVGGSGTELSNGIARSRIDLSYVSMRNVLPSSV